MSNKENTDDIIAMTEKSKETTQLTNTSQQTKIQGRPILVNLCNIFTILSISLFILAGFMGINRIILNNRIAVEKMEVISIEESDAPYDGWTPKCVIQVQKEINGVQYTHYISRVPTGYTSKTKDNDITDKVKVGDKVDVYLDSGSIDECDFKVIYNLDLFRSGELGDLFYVILNIAIVFMILGIMKITKVMEFFRQHKTFVLTNIIYNLGLGVIYLCSEEQVRNSTEMFRGLGESLIFMGLMLTWALIVIICSIYILVSDKKKMKKSLASSNKDLK